VSSATFIGAMIRAPAYHRGMGIPETTPSQPPLTTGLDERLVSAIDRAALPAALDEPVRYALLAGGKRLRPAIAGASALACSGSPADALPAAAAIEMIHAFSLVHDDLPAMDDDDLRRGRPTVHVAFGEAAAILAGDALMSLAFAEILRAPRGDLLAAELSCATTAMIAGQVDDTLGVSDAERPGDDAAVLRRIHSRKTGALLRAACRMGAISANADDETLDALTRCGDAVGLAYQIIDDLLDVEQPAEIAGKRTGKDAAMGKLTYPGVLGVEGSRAEAQRLEAAALEAIAPLGEPAEPLRSLIRSMGGRDR